MVHVGGEYLLLVLIKKENQDAASKEHPKQAKRSRLWRLRKIYQNPSVWKTEAKRGHGHGPHNFGYKGHQN